MSEERLSGGGVDPESGLVCPWCSAALPSDNEERCPSCGAALHEAATSEVPGVTRIDHEALLKGRAPTQRPRGIIGWLSGEYEAEAQAIAPGTLEPPDQAVRREMLRLELAALEAEVLARQAEAVAEVATETGQPVDLEDLGLGAAGSGAGLEASSEADAGSDAAAVAGAGTDGTADGVGTADGAGTADEVATEDARGA